MEVFPIRFYRKIQSNWNRKGYHKLDISASKKTHGKSITLRGNRRRLLLLRRRPVVKIASFRPARLFASLRDRYMDIMIGMSEKSSNKLSGPVTVSEPYCKRNMSKKQPVKMNQQEFENRLILEIYKSFATSRGYTTTEF